MKIKYRESPMNEARRARLEVINDIIEEYQADNLVLTLRQLFYQLVTRDVIPNKQNEYAKLSDLLKEGRMSGIVDWDAIEDRLREVEKPASWDSPVDILKAVARQYAKPRLEGQDTYVEVWVEKDALSGVLSRVTRPYHVPIMVNRGYSSASAMHASYERFKDAIKDGAMEVVILYLGDHDPSGIDMIRDVEGRIREFMEGETEDDFTFRIQPIALTRAQIKQYNPPPNPAKMADPRAAEYVAKNGKTSWEVDALPPQVLNDIVRDAILNLLDIDKYEAVLKEEEKDKKHLKVLVEKYNWLVTEGFLTADPSDDPFDEPDEEEEDEE